MCLTLEMDKQADTINTLLYGSRETLDNGTTTIEVRLLRIALDSIQRMNLSTEHYNIVLLVLMLKLVLFVIIRFIVKRYRKRNQATD